MRLSNTPTAIPTQLAAGEPDALAGQIVDRYAGPTYHVVGQLPAISVLMTVGFALVALGDYANRLQSALAEPLFWVGITVLIASPVLRLLAASPPRTERLGLVTGLAIGLYLVKVAHSPLAFTFPDELVHTYNVSKILETGHLFTVNPVLPVTPLYPGTASVTAALASATGLDPFHSGLIVAGAARVLLILALFLIAERLSGSSRVAGLAAVLYTANPNYLFYSAEFGYEPLALALALLVVLAIVARAHAGDRRARLGWTTAAVLGVLAMVITHHVTSYALIVALWAMVLVAWLSRGRAYPAPWDVALVATAGVGLWLAFVAGPTLAYLAGIAGAAFVGVVRLVTGAQVLRPLFSTAVGTQVTPPWQQALGFLSVALIAVGLPFGLIHTWRMRRQTVAVVLGLAGLAYFPIQALRLTAASWETANRSSEFLFVGIGFVLALALVAIRRRATSRGFGACVHLCLSGYVVLICLGGVVASWRADLRLPRPYITAARTGVFVQPQGVAVAEFARRLLGPGNIIATDDSNAELLLAYGDQIPLSGAANGVLSVFLSRVMDPSVDGILSGVHARYLVVDRRLQSFDRSLGIYPASGLGPEQPDQLLDPAAYMKFDARPDVSRIADSGDIVVYDVHP